MSTTLFNLPISNTDPPAEAAAVQLYAKTVLGVAQFFARASDGTISQISGGGGGMSIGGAIGGGATVGSLLFVGAGAVLAQDNANLFWDDTNNRLGIGTAAPAVALDIDTGITEAAIQLRTGGSVPVSAASTGRLRYNVTGQKFQSSFNGAPYFDIATYAAALTTGSVPFSNASNQLAQDNANLFWDNTNKRLGIGVAAPVDPLHVKGSFAAALMARLSNTSTTGYSAIEFTNTADVSQGSMGFGNSAVGLAHLQSKLFFNSGGVDIVVTNATGVALTFHPVSGSAGLSLANGSGLAVSAASQGRLRYNTTGQKFQSSFNGAAYFDVATYAAALTTGSVPFANASNQLAQDNVHFIYDTATNSLGLSSGHATSGQLFVQSLVATGPSAMGALNSAGAFKSYWGFFNATYAAAPSLQNKNGVLCFANENFVLANSTVGQFEFGMTAGSAFLAMLNGSGAAVSAAGSARLRYNSGTDKLQVSKNGAAYVDIV